MLLYIFYEINRTLRNTTNNLSNDFMLFPFRILTEARDRINSNQIHVRYAWNCRYGTYHTCDCTPLMQGEILIGKLEKLR